MATADVLSNIRQGNVHKKVRRGSYDENVRPIYDQLRNVFIDQVFDPERHLAFRKEDVEKTKRLTMTDLGIQSPTAISEIGVSNPFPLFTDEAVEIMRAEVLRQEVFDKWSRVSYSCSSDLGCVIRGYTNDCPFTKAAWTHPKTIEAVSTMAGVELEVVMDYEIAHVNLVMKSDEKARNEQISAKRRVSMSANDDDVPAVVGWHNDSYPFVCVLMLSDTEMMIGGETLLKTGAGTIMKTPDPKKGSAVVLQGREILHLAPIPLGLTERITAVTSYRAKDPMKPEMSVLSTVKPEVNFGSIFNEFYPQWTNYRLDLIKQRCDVLSQKFAKQREEASFDKEEAMKLLQDLDVYVHNTWKEMECDAEEYKI